MPLTFFLLRSDLLQMLVNIMKCKAIGPTYLMTGTRVDIVLHFPWKNVNGKVYGNFLV